MLRAVLCFYDEEPKLLARCISSLATIGVKHLVAVDGAYGLYPGGKASSDPYQREVIKHFAQARDIGLTLHVPETAWQGNEMEKRTFALKLAYEISDPDDWWFIIDADEVVSRAPEDLLERLENSGCVVADVAFRELEAIYAPLRGYDPSSTFGRLYKAQRLRLDGNHWTYRAEDGRIIGGREEEMDVELFDMSDLRIDHHRVFRDHHRQWLQGIYYDKMESTAGERRRCKCGAEGKVQVDTDWRMSKIGPAAKLEDMCDACGDRQKERNAEWFRENLGVEYGTLPVRKRIGRVPDATRS